MKTNCLLSTADVKQPSQYSVTPTFVRTMLEDSGTVLGVAAIAGHVYVARAESPEIEVYSAATLSLKGRLPVTQLRSPTDLAGCESIGCLFVADWPEYRIHRVDVEACRRRGISTTATSVDSAETEKEKSLNDEKTGWWTAERPWSLSLVEGQRRCTVLVTCDQVNLICKHF